MFARVCPCRHRAMCFGIVSQGVLHVSMFGYAYVEGWFCLSGLGDAFDSASVAVLFCHRRGGVLPPSRVGSAAAGGAKCGELVMNMCRLVIDAHDAHDAW